MERTLAMQTFGGFYLRDGEHDFTPENWDALLAFVEKNCDDKFFSGSVKVENIIFFLIFFCFKIWIT